MNHDDEDEGGRGIDAFQPESHFPCQEGDLDWISIHT